MKVRELIELLQTELDGDDEVYISADSEGNYFNKFSDVGSGYIEKPKPGQFASRVDCIYNDEVELTEEGHDLDEFQRVVILWP